MAEIHFTAVIKKILQPETDPAQQKPYKNNRYLIEEYNGGQYPESAILEVYDKNGDGTVWNNVLKDLGHFPTVGVEPFEVYFHLSAAEGTSQKTGRAYAIQKNLRAWKFGKPLETEPKPKAAEPGTPLFSVPEFNPQQQFTAPQPQFNAPQSQFAAPQQPQFNSPYQQNPTWVVPTQGAPAQSAPSQAPQNDSLPF